ncbi:unnamed protein product, partial [Rotaria magnacalcarata]
MLAHSPKDRSRSPHRNNNNNNNETTVNQTNSSGQHLSSTLKSSSQNDTSSQIDTSNNDANISNNNKSKKENESQLRMKSLKSFIQALINDSSSSLGSTYDEQVKALENACTKEFHDLSSDRVRRMIRNIFKVRKSQQSSHSTNSFLHQDHSNILPTTTTDRFNPTENNSKKNRSNSTSNSTTSKTVCI